MRLAELALASGFVADRSSQLRALDVEEGLVALGTGHLEPGIGIGERGLDLRLCLHAFHLTKSTHSGELSRKLQESGTSAATDCDRFFGESKSLDAIAEAEMRRRHRREHGAFYVQQPPSPAYC